ncbi:hypothetical protein MA16_Dca007835 [Dendrobium catenatum]|uniref:Transmembrane protein n=1 Tax=Dendrobium catenatum TaxID=906689 RepID=A0A2I0XIZ5_9ASPA|nr:hypothetical protein MA16_Dca007835 [Dendrobium catenatum]
MVWSNNNHMHNMAFKAYFIIFLLFLLMPCFMDCRAIIVEEIPHISKGGFLSKLYTNMMDLTKRRKLKGQDFNPPYYYPPTCGFYGSTPYCERCIYMPPYVPCYC